MRILLFDSIMESHVLRSLERAFQARGHEVVTTGQLSFGHRLVTDHWQLQSVEAAVESALKYEADLVVVFRPMGLPLHLLEKLRRASKLVVPWFSDDPVLWKIAYGAVIEHYDVILHCGGAGVLAFYESKYGRPTGINFPFWTDDLEFPYVYGARDVESDAMFLGNVGDRIRRQRYYQLASAGLDLRVHGNVGDDYLNISGGYLDSQQEILDAGSRVRLAVNIPQFFSDHHGAPTWFPGLGALGTFETPSRVVQYAAMGIPIVTLLPEGDRSKQFPEVEVVHDVPDLRERCEELLSGGRLTDLSARIRRRFESHYTATSRAMALERLVEDDSWRLLTLSQRADWFKRFEPESANEHCTREGVEHSAPAETAHNASNSVHPMTYPKRSRVTSLSSSAPREIAIVGRSRGDYFSEIRVASRALEASGSVVHDVLPGLLQDVSREDPLNDYVGVVDLEELHSRLGENVDTFVFVGTTYVPSPAALRNLRRKSPVRFYVHAVEHSAYSESLSRLLAQADAISVKDSVMERELNQRGYEAVFQLPSLVDSKYLDIFRSQNGHYERFAVVAERRHQIDKYHHIVDGFGSAPIEYYVAEEELGKPHGLAKVARVMNSLVTVVLPDDSRNGEPINRLFGHALLGGGIVVVPRGYAPPEEGSRQSIVQVANSYELHLKLKRLCHSMSDVRAIREAAMLRGSSSYLAEEAFETFLNVPSVN